METDRAEDFRCPEQKRPTQEKDFRVGSPRHCCFTPSRRFVSVFWLSLPLFRETARKGWSRACLLSSPEGKNEFLDTKFLVQSLQNCQHPPPFPVVERAEEVSGPDLIITGCPPAVMVMFCFGPFDTRPNNSGLLPVGIPAVPGRPRLGRRLPVPPLFRFDSS